MNQLEVQYQDILHTLDKLLANLGLMLEDYDVEYLTQADLYIEIFKIMFPVLEPVLNADFGEDITDEELIQYLIDVLAKDIIKMDLGHIRGELIAQGDAKNILNFLQLLFEISNMVVEKDDNGQKDKRSKKSKNKKLVKSSANSADQTSNDSERSSLELNQKYNSVQAINAEFSNSSMAADSNRDPSEVGAEEAAARYYEEQARLQNKMVFDQHQQMKGMKGESRGNSRSVSRISEVSKSKESSEYDRGMKKLSQKFDEFNPGVLQVKSLVADGNAKRGSYTSDDIREQRGENGEEEEDELEEEQEVTENEYEQEQQNPRGVREYTNENEEDEQEGEEEQEEEEYEEEEGDQDDNGEQQRGEYYQETGGDDEVIEEDDGFSDHMIKKISKEEVDDDLEYYSNDPINYNPLGAGKQRRHSHEPQKEENRARAIQSVDMKHKQMEQEQDEEEYEEGQEEEEEQDELVEEEDSQRQFYENEEEEDYQDQEQQEQEDQEQEYEEEELVEEIDPRYAEYREEMEEVAEEEYEEDTENAEPNGLYPQGYYHPEQAQQVGKKSKGKGKGKAKKTTKKKSPKAKAVEDFKKPKVEYRPLRPATAGMKRPQTAGSVSKGKVNKSVPIRSSGRKSNESTSSRSKKMAHSKSERKLNYADEEEQSGSQSGVQEDYSEDKAMEPKEYQENSQIPSQHGHANEYSGIEEDQEQEEQGYLEQAQQGPDGNVFRILSDNVVRVKENLRENRAVEDVPFDDENTVKMIRQQKEQYKQYLKDFVKDHQIKERKYEQMRATGEKNFGKKMKSEKIRDQTLRREFENQQKSLYFKMRDEKVNYLRRIHKTIFELEKKRIIDEKKDYMEFRKTRNVEACNMIESIKNQYKHKLSILRENNANQQYERKVASEAQRTFIKTLESELRMDQMKEVERLKDKWRLEKERFDMMIKDEGFLEQKVMQLYKKGVC